MKEEPKQICPPKYEKNRKIGGQIQVWTSIDPPVSLLSRKSFPQDILKYQETLELCIQH